MISEAEAYIELISFIEKNTTWESYGYYGPLIYTGPLCEKITQLQVARGIKSDINEK
jgi:hypothetical protein